MKFSDEELTTYLRWQGLPKDFVAAERIEQLVKELVVSNELGKALEEDAGQLRAKLAKALDALQLASAELLVIGVMGLHRTALTAANKAREVLEELEKVECLI